MTGVAVGHAIITATAGEGRFEAVTTVEVLIPVTGIQIEPGELYLTKGEIALLQATVEPEDATHPAISWASSNPGVVTVSSGQITAVEACRPVTACRGAPEQQLTGPWQTAPSQ